MASLAKQQANTEWVLWPCNVQAWHCWQAVQTQWRVGAAGATGLDYTGVRAWLDESGYSGPAERAHIWACILAAEGATLDEWAKKAAARVSQPPSH